MSEKINSDLIRGSVNTIVLRSLFESDRYGYEIIKYVEEQTNGQYILKQPTLYSSLRRLENMGFVSFYWGEETHGGRRKYYTLTDLGRSVFEKNQNEYRFSREMIDKLITENGEKTSGTETAEKPSDETAGSESDIRSETAPAVDAVPDVDVAVASPVVENAEEVKAEETPHSEPTEEKRELPADADKPSETYHSDIKADDVSNTEKFREMFAEIQKNGYAQKAAEEVPSEKRETRETPNLSATEYFKPTIPNENANYSLDSTDYSAYDANAAFASYVANDAQPQTENEAAPQYPTDSFYSYNAPAPELLDGNDAGFDDYKSKLSSIFDPVKTEQNATREEEIASTADKTDENAISIKEKIMVRSFGKITENVKQLGETVKIRTPDAKSAKEYNEQFYYYRNKLMLYKYGALFLLMMVEILLTYVIIRGFLKIKTDSDVALYVTCILVALSFPVVASAMYLHEPNKRKRLEFNLKTALIFRIIIMLQIILIVYALNVYSGMPIGGSSDHALSIALPVVMSTNVPVAAIIFNGLYKSKKFAVK